MDKTPLQRIQDQAAAAFLMHPDDRVGREQLDAFLVEAFDAGVAAARELDAEVSRSEKTHNGYRDRAGIDSRANSALLTLGAVISDTSIPSAIRLLRVAERMQSEPILTDGSPAARTVRRAASGI